jgi:probable rRNA maturation factor
MNVIIDLDNASKATAVPSSEQFNTWSVAALHSLGLDNRPCELSIRLVDESESAELNSRYRNKTGPTNILSFPMGADFAFPEDMALPLGDLAICVPVVEREAPEQNKPLEAHWAHLTVHGVLHLNGFDHEEAAEAEAMEQLEISILATLGFPNPYE